MNPSLRILNVEDDDAARYVKNRILSGAGHQVIDATCGSEALAALQTANPQVALIDMKLPDMTGFELTRRIRSDPRTCELPVIQMSAICVTNDDELDGIDSGADAYLVPPVESERLVAIVAEVFRARQEGDLRNGGDKLMRGRVRKVDAFIRANLDKRLSLEDLAGAAGLSPFYFTRMFKEATGTTPHDYLVGLRIEEATKMLTGTTLPMGEIATRVGFRTQAHFSAVFRRRTGFSPRTYRQLGIAVK